MKLADICSEQTRLFVKSEFGPASDDWPALSFSGQKIAKDFSNDYRPERDFIVYVGTADPTRTENPVHRQRLLSIVQVEPRTLISTRDLVPDLVWQKAVRQFGVRWEWSLPILKTYDIAGFPLASNTVPVSYASLGKLSSLGRCVPVEASERERFLDLDIEPVTLTLSDRAKTAINLNASDKDLRQALSRLMAGIKADVARAGSATRGTAPQRDVPPDSDIFMMLNIRWNEQKGLCALCDKIIPLKPTNRLLQISRDRTDSRNTTYDWHNTRLTHLACNLGKNDGTLAEWQEYLAMIRQGDGSIDSMN